MVATGWFSFHFLGLAIVERLLEEDWDVTVFDAREIDIPEVRSRVKFVKGDIRDLDNVSRACNGTDLVFHLAAAVPLTRAGRTFQDINLGGTRNVLDAAVKHKISRVVHVSTSAVYGVPRELPINENSPFNPLGQYGRAKLQAEVICRGNHPA